MAQLVLLKCPRVVTDVTAAPDTMTSETGQPGARGAGGRRVLLVEDDESVGVSLAGVLEMHGSRVTLVASVALALAMLRERPFDAVVSDLMLDDDQGRTGFAVLTEAARLQPGITAILITGYPSEAVAKRAAELPLAGLLSKPLEIADLLSALEPAAASRAGGSSRAKPEESVPAGPSS